MSGKSKQMNSGCVAPLILLLLLFGKMGQAKPNVLLIMADDIGIECFGSYGGTSYETPHIDKLAEEGIRFTHAYSQPLCTPTRVQIMTGKYNHRNWTYFGILDPKEKTFGHLMKEAGYRTCISGKWQLQSYDPPEFPNSERRRGKGMKVTSAGFDEHCLFHSWHTEDKGSRYSGPTYFKNGKLITEDKGKYGPDISVDFILDFMKRNKGHPAFVYYPMALPHWPMVPTPDSEEWADPSRRLEEDIRYFADMVKYMDKLVGRLVAGLQELALRENTLILFYSDNGTHRKIVSSMGDEKIRGGKATTAQSGVRVPLIASWPSQIKAGGTASRLVDASDFVPTLGELAGIEMPKSFRSDGVSFASTLFGKSGPKREWCFFWYDPRPGWDKERYTREVFALDHKYKLYSDGRFSDIRGLGLREVPLNPDALVPEAKEARKKLQKAIDQTMQPPFSPHAKKLVDAFGNPSAK